MNESEKHSIQNVECFSCIILAAGQSQRMGVNKMLLPWKDTTILGEVIEVFEKAGIAQIVVVIGGHHEEVGREAKKHGVNSALNQDFTDDSMLKSLKTGLRGLTGRIDHVFIALGDQPLISTQDITGMQQTGFENRSSIIIPSQNYRRGHPWLLPGELISEILELESSRTMKDFINSHEDRIKYYLVKSSNIFLDIDTPKDYRRAKELFGS